MMDQWVLLVAVVAVIMTIIGMAWGGAVLVGDMKSETRELRATVVALKDAANKLDSTMIRIFLRLDENSSKVAEHEVKIRGIERTVYHGGNQGAHKAD